MALQRQILNVPLATPEGGLDQSSQEEYLEAPKLLTANNVVFDKTGRIAKRHGFDVALDKYASGGHRIAKVGDALLHLGHGEIKSEVYTYNGTTSTITEQTSTFVATRKSFARDSLSIFAPNIAYKGSGELAMCTYLRDPDNFDFAIRIFNINTGATAYEYAIGSLSLTAKIQCCATTNYLVALYTVVSPTPLLYMFTYDLRNGAGATTSMGIDVDTYCQISICADPSVTDGVCIAYAPPFTTTWDVACFRCVVSNPTVMTEAGSLTVASGTLDVCVSRTSTRTYLGVVLDDMSVLGYGASGALINMSSWSAYSLEAASASYTTNKVAVTARQGDSTAFFAWERVDTSSGQSSVSAGQFEPNIGVPYGIQNSIWYPVDTIYDVVLRTKPFYSVEGSSAIHWYFGATRPWTDSVLAIVEYWVNPSSGKFRTVATVAPREAAADFECLSGGSISLDNFTPSNVTPWASGHAKLVFPVRVTSTLLGLDIADLQMPFSANVTTAPYFGQEWVESNGATIFSGALLWQYDQESFCTAQTRSNINEVVPQNAPFDVVATPSNTGGSIANGTYSYQFVWGWYDNTGDLHRSAPSAPVSVIVAGGTGISKVTITAPRPPIYLRNYSRPYYLFVYRTEDSGTVYYYVGQGTCAGADSVSFVDYDADATIISHEMLYTSGGALENVPPPPSTDVVIHKDRMFLACGQDVWYSKTKQPGISWEFHEALTISLPDGDPVTALASSSDRLLVFKHNKIYAVVGTGPDDTGAGDLFENRTVIAHDVGCINPRSVANTVEGIVFQSERGFYLMDPGGGLKKWTQEVEDDFPPSATVYGVIPVLDGDRVHVLTSSKAFTYDVRMHAWTTFSYPSIFGAPVSGVYSNGIVVLYSASGHVATENASYVDVKLSNGTTYWVTAEVKTAPIALGGIQGFQRLWRATLKAEYCTPHDLVMSIFPDDSALSDDYTWTYKQLADLRAITVAEQVTAHVARQKCQRASVWFYDMAPSHYHIDSPPYIVNPAIGTGQGCYFIGLVLEAGVKASSGRQALPGYAKGTKV